MPRYSATLGQQVAIVSPSIPVFGARSAGPRWIKADLVIGKVRIFVQFMDPLRATFIIFQIGVGV